MKADPIVADPSMPVSASQCEVVIRPFMDDDTPALLILADELRRHEASLYPRMHPGRPLGGWYVQSLKADCEDYGGCIFVATRHQRVIGYVCIRARVLDEARDQSQITYAMIDDLVVSRPFRSLGIGQQLITTAKNFARQRGATWIRIGVLATNKAAAKLYRKSGFSDQLLIMEMPLCDTTPKP